MTGRKKILIDLGKLKNRYSGLGEVSYNFGKTLSENILLLKKNNLDVTLLVPKTYAGRFGNEVEYITAGFFRRHFPFMFSHYDLWYAIHQDSGYMPGNKKTKYLLTIHDLNFIYEKNKNKIQGRLKKLQNKINRADHVTTISQFVKSEVEKYLEVTGITVETIYSGVVNTKDIKGERPNNIKETQKFFMHISTILPKKNVMALVNMMKQLPENKLVIAGSWDNGYAKKILTRIKDENIQNVIPLSKVNDAERSWLFKNCEAFFYPSYQEGFGLPVIEAMYCGKPVFTSRYTSLPEIGGDKAFYWDNFDPGYMNNIVTEKMLMIKNDPEFGSRLMQYAASFTWQKNVNRYITLFNELLS
jgi:glycosyltransferase involved in cell wall biosynthesis